MTEALLSTLIEETRKAVKSFGHKQSTLKHYDRVWRCLKEYFLKHGRETFSEKLVEKYIIKQKKQLDRGEINMQKHSKIIQRNDQPATNIYTGRKEHTFCKNHI